MSTRRTTRRTRRAGPERLAAERRRLRGRLSLLDRAVTIKTRIRYFVAVSQVVERLEHTRLDIDEFMMQWVDERYLAGASITSVADTLSGLHHYLPWSKGRLRGAWRIYGLWRKLERPRQAPPFPIEVVEGLVGRCVMVEDLRLALCLCLGFWGMLRTGEIFAVRFRHLLISRTNMVVRLGETKTGVRRQVDENVVTTHGPTILIARTVSDIVSSRNEKIWPNSSAEFRTAFKRLQQFFRLPSSFRPYSLRRGGATEDFRQHGLMERSLLRGRWGSSYAARQYIQEGLSMLTKLSLSPRTLALLASYTPLMATP